MWKYIELRKEITIAEFISCHTIEILAYIYLNGKRVLETNRNLTIGYVDIDKPYEYKMFISNHMISMVLIDDRGILGRKEFNYPSLPKLGYYLYPYFGGNRSAVRDINIKFQS